MSDKERPIEVDPGKFFEYFRQSSTYKGAFEDFYLRKSLPGDATNGEKRHIFEYSQNARVALVDFAQLVTGFSYNPKFYTPAANLAINQYIDYVQMMKGSQPDVARADLESQDLQRSIYHNRVADILTQENLSPNEKLGWILARLILVEKGLDTYESARESDIARIRRATP